jgi:hypothetical protein
MNDLLTLLSQNEGECTANKHSDPTNREAQPVRAISKRTGQRRPTISASIRQILNDIRPGSVALHRNLDGRSIVAMI